MPRLHVKHPCRRLELCLVDGSLEHERAKVEIAIPRDRLLLRRLAAEVGPQRVFVLPNDPRHEAHPLRQGHVLEDLPRLRKRDDLLHRERLQVHDRQHAIHRLARPVAGLDVVVVLDDVGPVADADKLRIVRPLHRRAGDPDQPRQHGVGRGLGIPACRQERGGIGGGGCGSLGEGPADQHLQFRFRADEPFREHVVLGESGQQNFAISGTVAVVGDVNRAVRGLKAIGIGDAFPLIEHEPALPGRAVVVGKPAAQLHAALVGVEPVAMLHEQQPARGEPTHVEAGIGLPNARRLGRLGPRAAAVGRGRLHDALRRAGEHPERFVLPLHDHVLVPVGVGKPHRPPPLPGRALIGRDEHIRAAERIEFLEESREWTEHHLLTRPAAVALIKRDGQHPFAAGEDGRLVEGHAVPDAAGSGPDGVLGVGVVAHGRPDTGTTVEHLHALVEEEPEPAQWIGPEIADEHTPIPGKIFRMRIDDQPRLRPGLAVVVAGGQHEERLGAVASRDPACPEPSLGCPLDADRHAVVEFVVVVLRQRRRVEHRWDQREVGDPPQRVGLVGPGRVGRHHGEPSLRRIVGPRGRGHNKQQGGEDGEGGMHHGLLGLVNGDGMVPATEPGEADICPDVVAGTIFGTIFQAGKLIVGTC